jgi:hypothetical protein
VHSNTRCGLVCANARPCLATAAEAPATDVGGNRPHGARVPLADSCTAAQQHQRSPCQENGSASGCRNAVTGVGEVIGWTSCRRLGGPPRRRSPRVPGFGLRAEPAMPQRDGEPPISRHDGVLLRSPYRCLGYRLSGQRAYFRPQVRMAPTIGPRSRPLAVSTYSARGGLIE